MLVEVTPITFAAARIVQLYESQATGQKWASTEDYLQYKIAQIFDDIVKKAVKYEDNVIAKKYAELDPIDKQKVMDIVFAAEAAPAEEPPVEEEKPAEEPPPVEEPPAEEPSETPIGSVQRKGSSYGKYRN